MFSSVGICLVAHYCDGSLEEVALFSKPASCCGGGDLENEKDCCTNDSRHVSFQKDFTFALFVSVCKTAEQQLFMVDADKLYEIQSRSISKMFCLAQKKNVPPNILQNDIVDATVLKI